MALILMELIFRPVGGVFTQFMQNRGYRSSMTTNHPSTSMDKNASWKPNSRSATQEFSALWSIQIDVILHHIP
jgi:hypothetical protein